MWATGYGFWSFADGAAAITAIIRGWLWLFTAIVTTVIVIWLFTTNGTAVIDFLDVAFPEWNLHDLRFESAFGLAFCFIIWCDVFGLVDSSLLRFNICLVLIFVLRFPSEDFFLGASGTPWLGWPLDHFAIRGPRAPEREDPVGLDQGLPLAALGAQSLHEVVVNSFGPVVQLEQLVVAAVLKFAALDPRHVLFLQLLGLCSCDVLVVGWLLRLQHGGPGRSQECHQH